MMQIGARREAQLEFNPPEEGAFTDNHGLHPSAEDGALPTQCDPPAGFEVSGLTKLC